MQQFCTFARPPHILVNYMIDWLYDSERAYDVWGVKELGARPGVWVAFIKVISPTQPWILSTTILFP